MDKVQAKQFSDLLLSEGSIDGWVVNRLLGCGKSAVVMGAVKDGQEVALKVFHPEIIERFSLKAQMIRIERERMLIGHEHPALVNIIEGGLSGENSHPYVVMSLVKGDLLSDVLGDIPRSKIADIVEQLARAAKHLEDMGIVHRDIKPENIMVTDKPLSSIKILDFGVMRPIGDSSATEQPGHSGFVGTHQYSPPEMLHLRFADTLEGWRAITFYQIGAVIHDLIMCTAIFKEYATSNANLIEAIDDVQPIIDATDVEPNLISLAKRCLLKNPIDRLKLVGWDDFLFSERIKSSDINARKMELMKRQSVVKIHHESQPLASVERARLDYQRNENMVRLLRKHVEQTFDTFSDLLPPKTVTTEICSYPLPSMTCAFPANQRLGFEQPFHVQLSYRTEENVSVVEVFSRAGLGATSNEVGWAKVGEFLDDLSDFRQDFETWFMGILEELVVA